MRARELTHARAERYLGATLFALWRMRPYRLVADADAAAVPAANYWLGVVTLVVAGFVVRPVERCRLPRFAPHASGDAGRRRTS